MKKIFALLLAASFVLSLAACAGEEVPPTETDRTEENDLFRYTVFEDHVRLDAYLSDGEEVDVPAQLGDQPVTEIGDAAFRNSEVRKVTLPDTVTRIGDNAFDMCNFMEQIVLPASLQSIGSSAFSECSSLTELTFPAGLRELGTYCFSQCLMLQSVTFSGVIEQIPDNCFSYCGALTQVTFVEPLPQIAESAFLDCPWADAGETTE